MPVTWQDNIEKAPVHAGAFSHAKGDIPALHVILWPHRSLPPSGFAYFIITTFVLFLFPLLAVLGTVVLWALLPFVLGALALVWAAFRRNYRDARLTEELALWTDQVILTRTEPDGSHREWRANPHWVRVEIAENNGPVANYITLKGGDRVVELGSFLSPQERLKLYEDLNDALTRINGANHPDYLGA